MSIKRSGPMGSFFKHEKNDLKGVFNRQRWPYLFDECGSRFGSFVKEVGLKF